MTLSASSDCHRLPDHRETGAGFSGTPFGTTRGFAGTGALFAGAGVPASFTGAAFGVGATSTGAAATEAATATSAAVGTSISWLGT